MHQTPSSEADSHSAKQEVPAFYGARRFITIFKTVCHWFLSWARYIYSTRLHPILKLSSSVCGRAYI